MKTNNTKIREYIIVKNDINNPVLKETMVCDWNGDLSYTDEIYRMLKEVFLMDQLCTEVSYVISLDHAKKLKGICKIGQGNSNETMTPMESAFTFLLLTGAYAFVIVHNHVSEMPDASISDKVISMRANTISNMFNMEFVGHMIVHPNGYTIDGGVMDGTEISNKECNECNLPYEILPNGMAVAYVFGQKIEGTVEEIKKIMY